MALTSAAWLPEAPPRSTQPEVPEPRTNFTFGIPPVKSGSVGSYLVTQICSGLFVVVERRRRQHGDGPTKRGTFERMEAEARI